MNRYELDEIFRDFMNIYNDKRPEDSKLRDTAPEQHRYLYYRFIKDDDVVVDEFNEFNELYNNVVKEDERERKFMETSDNVAWIREGEENFIYPQHFFAGIENEILFYESILEAIKKYEPLNKVKKESYNLWSGMNRYELVGIFEDFVNIYNLQRPADSKLRDTGVGSRLYVFFVNNSSVMYDTKEQFNKVYKKLCKEGRQHFFSGIENEILFYESILEAIEKYNEQPGIVRGGKRKTKKRKTKKRKSRRRKSRIYVYKNKS
jgi:hypothetical protein